MDKTRAHYLKVMDLLYADPLSAEAATLRAEIAKLEHDDPTLIVQRLDLFETYAPEIGARPLAERVPAGEMLT